MSEVLWQASWFDTAGEVERDLWRGVEAQHQVATMRLVDDLNEQLLLEQLLDTSKPSLPPHAKALHYLLATPFRYASPTSSRFRRANEPGTWYGAEEPQTVAAELAHWRWRHFMDSDGLRGGELVAEHTFFQARFRGVELDLIKEPWNTRRQTWRDPSNYEQCHRLATQVRERGDIAGIRYESARRESFGCVAVLTATSLSLPNLQHQQTWISKTTANLVLFRHDRESLEFRPPAR